ncbi:MAG: O-antigen ligase family protein [Bradymonadales bacterium]|nr:O-antigen ligase family protein [Bradymonadales bacterium]
MGALVREQLRRWRDPSWLAPLSLGVVWLVHTTAIDRLDITKLASALLILSLAALFARSPRGEGRPEPPWAVAAAKGGGSCGGWSGIPLVGWLGLALAVASIAFPRFLAARVEGWAPWVAAIAMFLLVRRAIRPKIEWVLGATATALVLFGMAQALGAGWFTGQLTLFAHRPVMGTLGNPDLYGVCLAGCLPFLVVGAKRTPCLLIGIGVVAAVLLSGSRTAWVMLLPSLVLALVVLGWRRAVLIVLVGLSLALLVDRAGGKADLVSRVADLAEERGTATGRIYLWRVNARVLGAAGFVGRGPESFRRIWPEIQAEYLAEHPEQAHFYSDLRHAHVDLVEIAADWGWIGLALMLLAALCLLLPEGLQPWKRWSRKKRDPAAKEHLQPVVADRQEVDAPAKSPGDSTEERSAPHLAGHPRGPRWSRVPEDEGGLRRMGARVSLFVLLLGGLATPVLFEVPSLLLAAMAAGILLPGPHAAVDDNGWARRLGRILAATGLLVTLFWVGQRTGSEWMRTSGLVAEIEGRLQEARELYLGAAQLDETNPLAHIMATRGLLEIDPVQALWHARQAVGELPTAAAFALQAVAAQEAGEQELAWHSFAIAGRLRPEGSTEER